MTEEEVEEMLFELLSVSDEDAFSDFDGWDTFSSKGIMTRNKGIVLTMKDGSEFQLSIVRSR